VNEERDECQYGRKKEDDDKCDDRTRKELSMSTSNVRLKTYEYHSHAEYSAVISNESVENPEWVVLEAAISAWS
jgi:hypothetical protein